MEITHIPISESWRYSELMSGDHDPNDSYRVDRGMEAVLSTSLLPFNHFLHLQALVQSLGRQPKVLEVGCGVGSSLVDLKKGVIFSGKLIPPEVNFPERVRNWQEYLIGEKLEGLGSGIHTTGLTLTESHAQEAASVEQSGRVDHMVVASYLDFASQPSKRRRFDFLFDSFGVGLHDPMGAIFWYGLLLEKEGQGITRLAQRDGFTIDSYLKAMRTADLEIIDIGFPLKNHSSAEVLFKRS